MSLLWFSGRDQRTPTRHHVEFSFQIESSTSSYFLPIRRPIFTIDKKEIEGKETRQ